MSLDREGIIVGLTDGVGAEFGAASRRSFYAQFERLERSPMFRDSPEEEQQSLVDLLALAAFYQSAIVPIESSGSFVSVLEMAGATHLRVAGDKLDKAYARKAADIAHGFFVLLERAHVPQHLLTYATLKQFIKNAQAFYQRTNHGTMD